MTDKEKLAAIKNEIESKYAFFGNSSDIAWGKKVAYGQMLNYINSLPEEPVSEDVNKAAEEYAYTNWQSNDYHDGAREGLPFDAIGHTEKSFKAGAQWKEEQMMSKAFHAEIDSSCSDGRCILGGNFARFETGDKVKVILIKED